MNNFIQPKLLRDVIKLDKGKPPAQQGYYGPDAALYLTPDYLRGGAQPEHVKPSLNAVHVKDGETIVLWDGSNAGEIFRSKQGVLASTMARVIHSEDYDSNYFFFALKGWEGYLKGQTSGSGIPHVDKEVLGKLTLFEFPKPEQSKIAEVLSKVDQAIEQTESLIAKHQRIKTGLMQDLLTRGIDEHGNLRSEETHEFKDSPLGRIPVGWEVKKLSKLATVERGKFTHRPRDDARFYGGSFPFIQTGDITSRVGRTVNAYTQTLSHRGTKVSREFPKGTIAITIAANIADTALLGQPMYFPDSVVGAVVFKAYSIRYVELAIRRWKPILERMAPQSAQRNINLEVLRPLLIATPTPEEQIQIANVYERAELEQMQLENSRGKLRSLKTALMQDLLTGKVRVTPLMKNMEAID